MPDQDCIQRALLRRWRPAYGLIKGKQPSELVAEAAIRALTEHLRAEGGIPVLEEFTESLNLKSDSEKRAQSVGEAVRSIEKRFGHSAIVKAAGWGALRHWAKVAAGMALPGAAGIAEEFCWQVLETSLLGKLDRLVGLKTPFNTVSDLSTYLDQLRGALARPIAKLARGLTQDPSAKTIRTPRSVRPRRSTRELIELPVISDP